MAFASTYISRTFTAGDRTKFTLSVWLKRGRLTEGYEKIFQGRDGSDSYDSSISFDPTDHIRMESWHNGSYTGGRLHTNRVFRDTSAWYHLVFIIDTANVTADDRMQIWVNGVRETSFSTDVSATVDSEWYINKSGATNYIGCHSGTAGDANCFTGEMSHMQFYDGYAYTASDFGQTDSTSGIWTIKTSGPSSTYGTNGFFMKFEDKTNLDLDSSSNALTFTTTGTLTSTNDNPSNNFATFNPLYIATSTPPTFQNGNKVIVFSSTVGWRTIAATLGVSTGKWYWECIGGNSSGHLYNGVCSVEWLQNGDQTSTGPCGETGYNLSQPSAGIYGVNGALTYSNTSGSGNTTGGYSATYVETDYISTYLDLDNHKLYFSKNGTIQNSGTGHDLPTGFTYLPCISIYNSDAAGAGVNFGNGTFFSTALTGTTYSDNDSIGTFKYSPNYGGAATFDGSAKNFMALCTKNIKTYG